MGTARPPVPCPRLWSTYAERDLAGSFWKRWAVGGRMRDGICRAITQLRLVEFTYDGRRRRVEPFCYGTSIKGNYVLRAYQTWTDAPYVTAEGWCLFAEEKMANAMVTDDTFDETVRTDYRRDDRQFASVVCAV